MRESDPRPTTRVLVRAVESEPERALRGALLRGARMFLVAAFALSGCEGEFRASSDASGGARGSGGSGGIGASGGGAANGGHSGAGHAGGASGGAALIGGSGGVDGEGGAPGGTDSGGSCSTSDSPALAACTVIEELGVFVSPDGNDAKGLGTREAPFATLLKALMEARRQSKRVYACSSAGPFTENVSLDDASFDQSELYGGFDCADWTYSADRPTAVVSPGARALSASGMSSLVIEDFSFTAADAVEPGESSAGAWIANSKGIVFRRVSFTAGNGARGADGEGSTEPAASGAPGNAGTAACQVLRAPNEGGASVQSVCGEATDSVGGYGGDGGTDSKSAGSGTPGEPITLGTRGQAGIGETAATTWNCGVGAGLGGGQVGSDAVAQSTAAGALTSSNNQGSLSATGYLGTAGQDGVAGTVGQGGGGGGGALAPLTCGTNVPRTGASGGGGGGGGCGGLRREGRATGRR
ncbi:MAG: hypothetical protein QM756_22880 [Polyangiaceae bacterium]